MIEKRRTRIQIRNEEKIQQAALVVFSAYGFHGATIEKIANLADMSQPNLHNYFKTKADLYIAVLDKTLETWLRPLGGLDAGGDPAMELRRYITKKMEMSRQYPEASRIFASEMLQGAPMLGSHLKDRVKTVVDEFGLVIQQWVSEGKLVEINPFHLIFLIWGATQHYADFLPQVTAVMDKSRLTKADYAEASHSITEIILGGLIPS